MYENVGYKSNDILYQQFFWNMGSQCVNPNSKLKKHPSIQTNLFDLQSMRSVEENIKFNVKVSNLRWSFPSSNKIRDSLHKVTFELRQYFLLQFLPREQIRSSSTILWQGTKEHIITINPKTLQTAEIIIRILDTKEQQEDKLTFKLGQICVGPKYHDHLLKVLKGRLSFQLQISQLILVQIKCNQLRFKAKHNHQRFGFSMGIILQKQYQFEKSITQIQNPEEFYCQLSTQIKSSIIKDSFIVIYLYNFDEEENYQLKNHFYLPFISIFDADEMKFQQKNGVQYETRNIYHEEIFTHDGSPNQLFLNLQISTSKLYIEHSECFIFSQNGVQILKPLKNQDKVQNDYDFLVDLIKKLKKIKNSVIQDSQSIKNNLHTAIKFFQKYEKGIFYPQNNVLKVQFLLVEALFFVTDFLTTRQSLNQKICSLINLILHRSQLSIGSICMINEEKTKKDLGCKFYSFTCKAVGKIVQLTKVEFSKKGMKCVHKLIAFLYFRFPYIQNLVVKSLKHPDDPVFSENTLTEIGLVSNMKTPRKNIAYDWKKSLFSLISSEKDYKDYHTKMDQVLQANSGWEMHLFSRQKSELYYGLLIELWNEGQFLLQYHGKVMWEYFPYYLELIETFLGEINKNCMSQFCNLFKQCSTKLLLNQKLLNRFMLYLFPKTCLYQIYSVLKCLELIESFFEVISKKHKNLPSDFNSLFFYTGVKQILGSNHSFLVVRILGLLYQYYSLLSYEFKQKFERLIFHKIFYKLFLHWSWYVRKAFFYFLQFRLKKRLMNQKDEIYETNSERKKQTVETFNYIYKLNSFIEDIYETQKIESKSSINERKNQEYYKKMKKNLQKKKRKIQSTCTASKEYETPRLSSKLSMGEEHQMKTRKWSLSTNQNSSQGIEQNLRKYLPKAISEYEEVKKDQTPDQSFKELIEAFKQSKQLFN